jgi:hypothetical protein
VSGVGIDARDKREPAAKEKGKEDNKDKITTMAKI